MPNSLSHDGASYALAGQKQTLNCIGAKPWRLDKLAQLEVDFFSGQGMLPLDHVLIAAPHLLQKIPKIVQERSQTVKVLIDSGGYQIISGKLNYCAEIRSRLFNVCRQFSHALILDAPTSAIGAVGSRFYSFNQCLDFTIMNAQFAVANAGGSSTRFLNVIQGRNADEAHRWLTAVMPFNDKALWGSTALSGIAFAGATRLHFSIVLPLIFRLLDRGLIQAGDRLHFLGTSHPEIACILTVLQDCLRQQLGNDLTVTFDSATPFLLAGRYGRAYDSPSLTRDELRVPVSSMPFDDRFVGSCAPWPVTSPIADRLTLGDLNVKKGRVPWDTVSSVALSMHNAWVMHHAIALSVNRLRLHDGWSRCWLPDRIVAMAQLIRDAFAHHSPYDFVEVHARELDQLSHKSRNTSLLEVFLESR